MTESEVQERGRQETCAVPWILEHLFVHPGTYELPLRTMYTLNSATHSRHESKSSTVIGNAFPPSSVTSGSTVLAASAAEQLKANLTSHMAQLPAQPTSLPPSFITSFVRRCFSAELAHVDFPQSLTALDYLKDLETRRRNEIIAALTYLGVDAEQIADRGLLKSKNSSVYRWIEEMDRKELKVEALYSHVYLGLRRWTLVNEMSLTPFDKQNCLAMLNTLFPPALNQSQFVKPTKQLTQEVLQEQRKGFFRYITSVEKKGTAVLQMVMNQHKRPGDDNGWPKTREDLDNYLRMANDVINECLDITGRSLTPMSAVFPRNAHDGEDEHKRKVDSGISFGCSGYTSKRNSDHSHSTRPSTSSSVSQHSRQESKDKMPDKGLAATLEEEETVTVKHTGSALERIARELRKIGSRNNIREESQARPQTSYREPETQTLDEDSPPATPGRGLRLRRSFRNLRSVSRSRSGSTSQPGSRRGSMHKDKIPTFDAEAMRRQREVWEASHRS